MPIAPPVASNPFLPVADVAPIAAPTPAPESVKPRIEDAKPSTPSLPPEFRKRSRGKVFAFVIPLALVLAVGGFVVRSQMKASKTERAEPVVSVEPPPPPPAPAPEPPPPPTAAAEPPPSASAAKKPAASAGAGGGAAPALSADPSKTAYLDATPLPPGRKIIVDGRMVGTSPRRVVVRCGNHTVQIGDLPPENIHFPCGGEVSFSD